MSFETIHILEQISREKGIDKDVLIDALKSAVEAAARKLLPDVENMQSSFSESTGEVEIFAEKTVVESVEDPDNQIDLKSAQELIPDAELGETVLIKEILENYGRIAAQLAKQVILQKVREAEIELVYNEFIKKKNDLISGMFQRFEHGDMIIDLGKIEGVLPRREQVFRETFNRGERVRAYVLDVKKTSKHASVILSRTHTGLIKRLFEMEVPEISEGMVEIMAIAREPNGRTKITVKTNDRDIDAVGACVGMRGMRVQSIVQELRGEKIDIVEYSEDPQVFIRNALSPAKISRILMDEKEKQMTLIVADDQMSLAIGKKGQNVRLAAKLVKWKIDIKGESEAGDLLEKHPLSLTKRAPDSEEDLLELVKVAKGLGEKIVAILFSNEVTTIKDVLEIGTEGLTKLSGIGPKKAEAIFNLAEENCSPAVTESDAGDEEINELVSEGVPVLEDDLEDTGTTSDESVEETEEIFEEDENPDEESGPELADNLGDTVEETVASSEEDEQEEAEMPLDELEHIDPETISILKQNGFQDIAELSVTPLEELVALDGMDQEIAESILEQAKQHMEKYESAQ